MNDQPVEALLMTLANRVRTVAYRCTHDVQQELKSIAQDLITVRKAVITKNAAAIRIAAPPARNRVQRTKNPAPGKRRCSKCGEVKDIKEFAIHNSRTGALRSDCKSCYNAHQRATRTTIKTILFELRSGDACLGQSCPACGLPFRVGQKVHGESLRHERCPSLLLSRSRRRTEPTSQAVRQK